MKVYLIRHGESENNLKGLWTGWQDVPLTDKGRTDAALAGKLLKGVSFDKIYSSDLSRAIETARIVIPGCDPRPTPMLREVNVGNIAGKPLSFLSPEERAKISSDGYTAFGGESIEKFRARLLSFRDEIEKLDCENVALFAHAGVLRKMLDIVTGIFIPRKSVSCNNCAIAVFEFKDGVWSLYSWINVT